MTVRQHGKRAARNLVFTGLRLTLVPWALRQLVQRHRVTIAMYHDITADRVRVHFKELKKRYNVISLEQYLDAHKAGTVRNLPPRALVITFDDGHQVNHTLTQVLKELEVPVTIFLCSGIVGTHRRFWFLHPIDPAMKEQIKRTSDAERLAFLERQGFTETREFPERQALSDEEILELKCYGDFQAHTVFHPCLPQCTDERARREIRESKTNLERRYGLSIHALAYPNGDYSDREVRMAREEGYDCALTVDGGFADGESDLFRLPRLGINDRAGLSELIVEVSGLWSFLRPARRRLAEAIGTLRGVRENLINRSAAPTQ